MGFVEAIKSGSLKLSTFSGRATRSEYWYFYLFCSLVCMAIYLVLGVIFPSVDLPSSPAVFLTLSISFRRMHDIGKPGWLSLVSVPCAVLIGVSFAAAQNGSYLYLCGVIISVGFLIYYLILLCKDSQPGTNQYGPNPKEIQVEQKTVVSKVQTEVNGADEITPTAAENSPSTIIPPVEFCKQCGAKRENNSRFCVHCGTKFE